MSDEVFPGDNIIPSPSMLYDQTITIGAEARTIFPWLLQLGKSRGGWYAPSWVERFLPLTWRATYRIETQWQNLSVGDRVPDYGFSSDDYFIVAELQRPDVLVYRSERYGCVFSWALVLRETASDADVNRAETVVHLRFRGRISSKGWKRRLLVWGGEKLDSWTTRPMLEGLKERAERTHGQ